MDDATNSSAAAERHVAEILAVWQEAKLLAEQVRLREALALLDRAAVGAAPGSTHRRSVLSWRAFVRRKLGDRVGAIEDYAALRQAGDDSVRVRMRIAAL